MSRQLISRNTDLKRLGDEGYDVEIRKGHLLVKQVPYVNGRREIRYGILASTLDLAGDLTIAPTTHVAYFAGEHPCHNDGSKIERIAYQSETKSLAEGLVVNHSFSTKPKPSGAYADYYDKMATYITIIASPAQSLDPSVSVTPTAIVEGVEEVDVFNYLDTASTRAGISVVTDKLKLGKGALVGVGGTGAYILDLIAKTPVRAIHLFDGDTLSSHNAFRSPGAPSIDELRQRLQKVSYCAQRYSRMHRHVIPHDAYIEAANVNELRGMDFVFLCLDRGSVKKLIIEKLEEWGTPFIDVGMGVELVDGALLGIVRTTTSTREKRDHVRSKQRIPVSDGDRNDEYARNIQIADLNALNAALAVINWKKLCGFYTDLEREYFSTYTIDGNMLINEDQP